MKHTERAAWATLGASGLFLLTLPWAYEILRPLRDAADPNEFTWGVLICVTAIAALVLAWLPGASTRVRIATSAWLALLVVLLLVYVYVLFFVVDWST